MRLPALLLLSLSLAHAEPKGADAISAVTLAEHVKVLSSDAFGGRAPGTAGEEKTIQYLTREFSKLGLKTETQKVPLVSITANPMARMVIKGESGDDLILAYSDDQLMWTQKVTASVTVAESALVYVGNGVVAPEYGWNDYAGVDVRGKTVIMHVNDPGFYTKDETLFKGKAMTWYGRWDYKLQQAAKLGAAAAIIIHETDAAAYPWQTVQSSWSGPKFRLDHGKESMPEVTVIEAWVTKEAAQKIFTKAGLDYEAEKLAANKRGFQAKEMDLTFSGAVDNEIARVNSRNVIAKIEGTEAPNEGFIYMAHWDHLGTKPEQTGDNIYNGALDNATGTAGLLELARAYMAGEKPKRSVYFIAVTAEEQGTLGSEYYSAHPALPAAMTVGGINMDGLNIIGETRDMELIGYGLSDLDGILGGVLAKSGRVLKPDSAPEKGGYYRSDHFELSKAGIPMIFPGAGEDHVKLGRDYGRAKSEEYTAKNYHMPGDEFDPNWVLSGAVADLKVFYETGRAVTDSRIWPNWVKDAEFRALRDQQRSAAESGAK